MGKSGKNSLLLKRINVQPWRPFLSEKGLTIFSVWFYKNGKEIIVAIKTSSAESPVNLRNQLSHYLILLANKHTFS